MAEEPKFVLQLDRLGEKGVRADVPRCPCPVEWPLNGDVAALG